MFLIDGLGWEQLKAHPDEAPFMTSLLATSRGGTGRPLTAGFPATTATSLASVGTGLPPGAHGLPGYTVRNPDTGELMNQLRWQPWTPPGAWQPYPTVFQLADEAGVHAAQVSSPTFENTPLTKVALSGGTFLGRLPGEERMDLAAEQLAAGDRSLVYTYYAEVDGAGHRFGVDSDAWRGQLMYVDRLVQRLAEQLPPRTALYVTADHGMIDIPFDEQHRIDFDEDWELRAGVALLGGEGRARHVYAVPGAENDVLTCWREVLGEQFWVASRDEAIAAGWFGPRIDERVYAPDRRRGRRRPGRRPDHRLRAGAQRVGDGRQPRFDDPCRAAGPAARSTLLKPARAATLPSPHDRKVLNSPCPSWCSSPERWTAGSRRWLSRSSTTAPRAAFRA